MLRQFSGCSRWHSPCAAENNLHCGCAAPTVEAGASGGASAAEGFGGPALAGLSRRRIFWKHCGPPCGRSVFMSGLRGSPRIYKARRSGCFFPCGATGAVHCPLDGAFFLCPQAGYVFPFDGIGAAPDTAPDAACFPFGRGAACVRRARLFSSSFCRRLRPCRSRIWSSAYHCTCRRRSV